MAFLDDYRIIASAVNYDPDNANYKAEVRRTWNANMRQVFAAHPWTFARKTATLDLYGDVVGGTVTFTNNLRTVIGVGTAFDVTMEGSYIQNGLTNLKSARWARVGRVFDSTTMYLVDPWVYPTVSTTAYTVRQRYVPMPKDCVNYQNVWDADDKSGTLGYRNAFDAERMWYDEDISGTPRWYTDADSYNPPTPERALTATASNTIPGALVSGRTYVYKYTWYLAGVESGSSPEVEVTLGATDDTVTLTGFEQSGPTDGRYVRIYRAEKDVGVFYRLITTYNLTTYVDDGSITDRTYPYLDGDNIQYIRPYPRYAQGDGGTVQVRYHYMPREIQKDTDYVEAPLDASEAIRALTIADILGRNNAMGQADYWRTIAKERMKALQQHYLTQRPNVIVRRPFVGGNRSFLIGTDPRVV